MGRVFTESKLINEGFEFIEAFGDRMPSLAALQRLARDRNVSSSQLATFNTQERGWASYFIVGAEKSIPFKSEPMLP